VAGLYSNLEEIQGLRSRPMPSRTASPKRAPRSPNFSRARPPSRPSPTSAPSQAQPTRPSSPSASGWSKVCGARGWRRG